jgi:FtsX-like permease family
MRLGLRLAVAGGREALTRLIVIATAVALGLLLLLTVCAGVNGFFTQNQKYSWFYSGTAPASATDDRAAAPVWWRAEEDLFDGASIGRVDVAGTGPDSPVPPGIPRLPGPGEYYASPAMAALLRATPADQLAARYPGRLVGTIGPAALPSPDTLAIVIGHRPDELAHAPHAARITHIQGTSPGDCRDCTTAIGAAGIDLVVSVIAGGMLFPVLIFIGTATRLNAARREERFAAMRLVGATPRQITLLTAVEAGVAAVAGTALGFALFYLLRPWLAGIPFTGDRFFPADLRLSPAEMLAAALGVPAAAALAAQIALRRVTISPLGVGRRVTPRPPRAYRLIPLAAGLAELFSLIGRRPGTSLGQTLAFLAGFVLIMIGLIIAGPWLTMIGSRLLAGVARRPAALLAARRLADSPRAGFRAVSGLMLALFVTSVATGVIGTINLNRGPAGVDPASRAILTALFWDDDQHPGVAPTAPDPVPGGLRAVPGVRSVTVVRANPDRPDREAPPGVASCADLAGIPEFGACPAGAGVVAVTPEFGHWDATRSHTATVWPAAALRPGALTRLPVLSIVVRTDGSVSAVERARTIIERAYPSTHAPTLATDFNGAFTNTLAGWRRLAGVVVIASLVIAGTSLAVAAAGGVSERKRPFSLLRLAGVPLGALRRAVLLECGVPLLVAAALATGTGLVAAHLFLRAQMQYALHPPGVTYYLITGAGLLASLGIVASTLPMLRRVTGPETARNG